MATSPPLSAPTSHANLGRLLRGAGIAAGAAALLRALGQLFSHARFDGLDGASPREGSLIKAMRLKWTSALFLVGRSPCAPL